MNFSNFDQELPSDWEAVVVHEFGHALGFEHEHQNPVPGCDFRFEDDPGYIQSKDDQGWFRTDDNGKRPGLYTYLGGYKNFWSRQKVDANLRSIQVSSAFLVGSFDKDSIMKYVFSSFMFQSGEKSPCYTDHENVMLSKQDIVGAQKAYPKGSTAISTLLKQRNDLLSHIQSSPGTSKEVLERVNAQLRIK